MSEKDGVVDSAEMLAQRQNQRDALQADLNKWKSPSGQPISPTRILDFLTHGGVDPRDEILQAEEQATRYVGPEENRAPVQQVEDIVESSKKTESTVPTPMRKNLHESSYSGLKRVIRAGDKNPYENLETVPEWWQNVAEHVRGGKIATSQNSQGKQPGEELKRRLDALKEQARPIASAPKSKAS